MKKYHSTFFHAQIEVNAAALEEDNNNNEDDENDDCGLVSLPGEHGHHHDDEMVLNDYELEEDKDNYFNDRLENIIANETRPRDKRRRVVVPV